MIRDMFIEMIRAQIDLFENTDEDDISNFEIKEQIGLTTCQLDDDDELDDPEDPKGQDIPEKKIISKVVAISKPKKAG